jgi:hypothetical protein
MVRPFGGDPAPRLYARVGSDRYSTSFEGSQGVRGTAMPECLLRAVNGLPGVGCDEDECPPL